MAFELGVFLGLGGMLICSFLGGMRAVTWTQVAQYLVMLVAFLLPVAWLSLKQTGSPLPQLVYGQQLARVTERERELMRDPAELEVMRLTRQRADLLRAKLAHPAEALAQDRAQAQTWLDDLRQLSARAGSGSANCARPKPRCCRSAACRRTPGPTPATPTAVRRSVSSTRTRAAISLRWCSA